MPIVINKSCVPCPHARSRELTNKNETGSLPRLSTSVPNLGGEYLDGRFESLTEHEDTLSLIESGELNVKVSFDGVVVN